LNDEMGAVTTSSCSGHLPYEKYEDLDETMHPYITLDPKSIGFDRAMGLLESSPYYSSTHSGRNVTFDDSLIGKWPEMVRWMKER
jgi:hypothetical protein